MGGEGVGAGRGGTAPYTADNPSARTPSFKISPTSRSAYTSTSDLRGASERLAGAIQQIGIDRWPGFLAEALDRARAPATTAAIERSEAPIDFRRDAIKPVYPLEAAIGIIGGGFLGGAARQAVGAVVKRLTGKDELQPGGSAGRPSEAPANPEPPAIPQKQAANPGQPRLPNNPDDLLEQGWEETSHPKAAARGRRTFVNPETGQEIEFDKGRVGEPGWRGEDHYHLPNPDGANKSLDYLDSGGNPVRKGTEPSHIRPNWGS